MKILVLGSGAKDHAITWLFSKSRRISGLYIAPGNAGTATLGTNLYDIDLSNPESVAEACRTYDISYVFAGTETPIAAHVPDYLRSLGISTFGASSNALALENDRSFARAFSDSYDIPTSHYSSFSSTATFRKYLEANPGMRMVIKKNEIAPSRVMLDSADPKQLMEFAESLLEQGDIIVEEHLKGMSISLTVLMDERGYKILPICSDYNKSGENDRGEATGGMGSICPVPIVKSTLEKQIIETIIEPTFTGLREENLMYKGVLIFSLILTDDGPRLVDYHVRFNDPATQAMAPLIQSDFVDVIMSMENQELDSFNLEISDQSSVAVVVASEGYPSKPVTGRVIEQLPNFLHNLSDSGDSMLFYGAVDYCSQPDRELCTNGGRCFTAVSLGTNIIEANSRVYNLVEQVQFLGAWFRKDIGNKFFEE